MNEHIEVNENNELVIRLKKGRHSLVDATIISVITAYATMQDESLLQTVQELLRMQEAIFASSKHGEKQIAILEAFETLLEYHSERGT